ncbi:MAG: hypothetical protein LUH05_09230 [Candidatus Gastranaerophilales bacterium]|nr:hypothetical protein [Candidatus Gastranaerophilales bacterium]
MQITVKENIKVSIISIIFPFVTGWIFFRNTEMPNWYLASYYVFITIGLYSYICDEGGEFIYKTGKKIGAFLGKYLAIIILAFIYIITVIPTGVLMKIVKRDRLRLKKPDISTYWIDYENKNTDYEYQF